MQQQDKERAKDVICEIARQSPGDEITGKTKLFKAFYFAHLYYVTEATDYLTEWPIVHMPRGPGIDNFDLLLSELVAESRIESIPAQEGPFPTTTFRAISPQPDALSQEAKDAIRKSVEYIDGKNAYQLSEYTHDFSRSWRNGSNGDELNIYADLLRDHEAGEARRKLIDDAVNEVFGA